jgi:ferredoxin
VSAGKEKSTMRVVVDLDLCGGHGVCERTAPRIFRVVDEVDGYAHVQVIVEDPPESLREEALAAERQCPNRVIRIVG